MLKRLNRSHLRRRPTKITDDPDLMTTCARHVSNYQISRPPNTSPGAFPHLLRQRATGNSQKARVFVQG